ncbi:MAG: ABC transporter substrate-binding protein [Methyloceanibacter sp.]|uniref:substrate-binding periplasmic protein n=1 Tax=Methyloceanibacter sp. TaxID=1965321 RepID=UPI003C68A095
MHTVVLALLTAVAVTGKLKLIWPKVIRHLFISVLLLLGLFGGLRLFFEDVVPQEYRAYHALNEIDLLSERPDIKLLQLGNVEPLPYSDRHDRIKAIEARGRLRVGYVSDSLPFAYERQDGDLVGLEVDIIQMIANDMSVGLDLIEVKRNSLGKLLSDGRIDIAIGGLFATPGRALKFKLSEPYMDASLSLVVRDHRRREFSDWEQVRGMKDIKLALLNIPFYVKRARASLPDAQVKVIESPRVFLGSQTGEYDAMLYSAEAGSAWTLLYPGFSVVVPNPNVISVPIVFGLPADAATLANYVNAWISLNKSGSLVDRLYNYWILGKGAQEKKSRWSVLHNVFGWGQN